LMNIHVKGVFFLTQKLLPLIKDGGRIVNLSTGLSRIILPGSAAYASMKGAIASLLSEDNKWVNAQRIEVSGGQSI
jgi:NAD(P)-dependent dehydrogenase (short-subunit alcohol dehydrogenase family)